ncbi:MAG: hypothetical protein ABR586_07385 [Thermoplasmatota archaeon]
MAAVLAGCAAPPAPAGPPAAPTPAPARLELSDCSGWDLSSPVPFLGPTAPGEAPPGWEPDALAPSGVRVGAYGCHRLAVGPLERPVRLLFDAHDHATIPATCKAPANDPAEAFVLHGLWSDDAEAARYLNATFGLPARPTPIAEQAQGLGAAGRLHTWSWGDPQARSTLSVADVGDPWSFSRHVRLFWPHGDGVGMLDLAYTYLDPSRLWRPAQGTLQPPMLLAGAFAGPVAWQPSFAVAGSFTLYQDRACLKPEAGP